jgi:transposase-like protein
MQKSLKLAMPKCPECGSEKTVINIKDYSNIVRVPAATATAAMIGVPLSNISFVCKECKYKFYDSAFLL